MAFLWSTPGPSPCPACDAELGGLPDDVSECPSCGQSLAPVRVASSWRRLLAFVVDFALLTATALPLTALLYKALGVGPLTDGQGIDALLQILAGDLGLVLNRAVPLLLLCALYFVLFAVLGGQTPGQRLLGIRLVGRHGDPPKIHTAALRVLGSFVGMIPLGLGGLWMLFDMESRTWHDHLAQTYVVRNG